MGVAVGWSAIRRCAPGLRGNLRAAVAWAFDAADVDDVTIGVRVIDTLACETVIQPS